MPIQRKCLHRYASDIINHSNHIENITMKLYTQARLCTSRLGMIWGPGGGLWLTAVWDQFGYDSSINLIIELMILIIVTRVLDTEFLGDEQLDLIIDRETLTSTPTIESVTTSRPDYFYEVLEAHCLLFLYALYHKFDVLKDQCPNLPYKIAPGDGEYHSVHPDSKYTC